MAATTWAPSPIALPTRLVDPDRTSPTANTPAIEDFERRGQAALCFAEARAGDDEAAWVDRDPAACEPFRRRIGPDEEKDMADRRLRLGAGATIPPTDPLETRVRGSAQGDNFRHRHQFDIRRGGDAVDQIARHAVRKARSAHHHADLHRRESKGRRRLDRRNCRRRPERPLRRRKAAPRSARPSTRPHGPRIRRGRRPPAAGIARRLQPPPPAP